MLRKQSIIGHSIILAAFLFNIGLSYHSKDEEEFNINGNCVAPIISFGLKVDLPIYSTFCEVYKSDDLSKLNITESAGSWMHTPMKVKGYWKNNNVSSDLKYRLFEETESLEVSGVEWPPLPASSSVVAVLMTHVTPQGVWGGCSKLQYLDIYSLNITLMSPNWLAKCSELRYLKISDMSVSEICFILESVPRLKALDITDVSVDSNALRDMSSFRNRKFVNLIEKLRIFRIKYDLGVEKAKWTEISVLLTQQLAALRHLNQLAIHYIPDFDFCSPGNNSTLIFPSLQSLSFHDTSTSQVCFRHLRLMPQLKHLDLHLKEPHIQFSELPFNPESEYQLLTTSNVLRFTREDYDVLYNYKTSNGTVNLDSLDNSIECDCVGSLWLARAMQARLLNVDPTDPVCSDGTTLADQSCEQPECDRITCASRCVCCQDKVHNGIFADCRGANLGVFPNELLSLNNLTALLAPNNSITSLPNHLVIPNSLQLMDLSDNKIWQIEAISSLFANSKLRLRLSGNPIDCTCENKPLIEALQNDPHKQIEDKDGIVCVQNKTKIRHVKVSELCDKRDREQALNKQRELNLIAAVVATVVIAVIALALIVGYYYRRQLQIFLYARGWCLCCIQGDKLDAERYYDVFLSFCHDDTELVLDQLLPALDQEYSVCVHLRDWCPGGMIPSQIAISVEQSRRTIVVVSKNFLKSLWGMLEFRTAYASSLEERRVRVVMVILDDALDAPDLAADLRAYVRLNTYLQWGDPWFWQKLRFALPHHPSPRTPFSPHANHLPNAPPSPQAILSLPASSPPHVSPAPSASLSDNESSLTHSPSLPSAEGEGGIDVSFTSPPLQLLSLPHSLSLYNAPLSPSKPPSSHSLKKVSSGVVKSAPTSDHVVNITN